jgi:outer membrane protein OmpA-like peptidoglycan-associated protein
MRVRKRDQWLKSELDLINERIDRMDQRKELWELRDRMDDIESRLTDLSLEVQDVRAETKAAPGNPLAELSELTGRNITVRFGRNSVSLDPEYQVLLNEVFEQLARSPEERVLITGYTDRSGDPGVNLSLSEQRAKVVRNYLLQRGIAAERLLLNYYGDSRSLARDPNERRVEVEWLH